METKNHAQKGKSELTEEYVYQLYCERVKPRLDDVKRMFFEGYSFTDIAKELEVSNSLLWKMRRCNKTQYAELREAFQFYDMQIQNVETSLYRSAIGFYYEVDEVQKGTKEYYNKKGKKCRETVFKVMKVRRYYEPDVNAIKFFLVNHAAKKYSPDGSSDQAQQQAIIEGLKNVFVAVKRTADDGGNGDE